MTALAATNTEEAVLDGRLFRFEPPVSRHTLAGWQRELDALFQREERKPHLVIRWEPGDLWQPIQRFMLWLAQDPNTVQTEPWIVRELQRGSPRARGHYCGDKWCLCEKETRPNRWVGGTTRFVDYATWRFYQETGLYGWRWWTIQGTKGGHRFAWEPQELASKLSQMKGGPMDTPAPGDLPYAPFDKRVLNAVIRERRAADVMRGLDNASQRQATLTREDRDEAEVAMKALWEWTDERMDAMWHAGAELLPRWAEDRFGRAPTGTKNLTDYEAIEEQHLTAVD